MVSTNLKIKYSPSLQLTVVMFIDAMYLSLCPNNSWVTFATPQSPHPNPGPYEIYFLTMQSFQPPLFFLRSSST